MSDTTQQIISWAVSRLNRQFHGPQTRCGGVPAGNITKEMYEFVFHDISIYVGFDSINLEHFADVVFNLLDAGFIFLFSGPVATLRRKGWVDCHEIIRICTQGTIG